MNLRFNEFRLSYLVSLQKMFFFFVYIKTEISFCIFWKIKVSRLLGKGLSYEPISWGEILYPVSAKKSHVYKSKKVRADVNTQNKEQETQKK